jgi:arabinofuranosyltransferase
VLAVLGLVVKDAWICDDAYITFRSVDNLWRGAALEWNPGWRVQGSTHPLWLLLLAALQPLTGEPFWSATLLSLGATGAALGLLAGRVAPTTTGAVLALCALGASKAFVDFSTSGLANPLTHLLLVLAAWGLVEGRGRMLGLAAGALLLTRLDNALLVAPMLLGHLAWRRDARPLVPAAGLPLAWAAFSLVYFGHPLPNTFLAKLAQQIELPDRVSHGLAWISNSAAWDPVTLSTIAVGVLASLLAIRRAPEAAMLAAGSLLGVGYSVSIGGDFMSGRYLAAPLLLAVLALSRASAVLPGAGIWAPVLAWGALALGISNPRSPLRTDLTYSDVGWDETGIADERGFYFQGQGILPMLSDGRRPEPPGPDDPAGDTVLVDRTVGINGYLVGPNVHLVDRYALTDPLLARLPVRFVGDWRTGHWDRPIPPGYRATLRSGNMRIRDPDIAACFRRVEQVHTGPVFTADRWRAIWVLGTIGCTDLWQGRWMRPQKTDWHTDD